MSDYERQPDVAGVIGELQRRIAELEAAQRIRQYATADLPAASAMKGAIVFDTTALKHKGSDGTAWNALW